MKFIAYILRGTVICCLLSVFMLQPACRKEALKTQPPTKVQAVNVLQTTVPIKTDFVGQTYGYKDIPIRARVDGFLTGIHFQEGTFVRQGQLLYSIDPEPFKAMEAEAMSGVAEAQTMLAKAESDLNRIRPLAEINAVSQSDLDAAVAQFGAAQASLDAANANLKYARINLGYTSILSPITGVIGKTLAKTGEYVGRAPNPVVLNTVSIIDTILVQFSITESDYLWIARQVIEQEQDTIPYGGEAKASYKDRYRLVLADGSIFPYPGRFNFTDRQVDPTTGTLLVQVSFPNPNKLLRPGQFARVQIVVEVVENGLVIPQRSVRELQGLYQVYVVNDTNAIDVRPVKLAAKVGSMYLVQEGLTPTDRIVYEGLNLVRPGQKVDPQMVEVPAELMKF
ncbi:MAG: efflux RND transporter periplasmic adaptor subunit [Lentimicrobiaceae bacterium]|nr:efflux RND transporter periplasmic adaptor subunit [Lentimicrobiaceae bacterium]